MKVAYWWVENRQRGFDVHVHGENMISGTFMINYI